MLNVADIQGLHQEAPAEASKPTNPANNMRYTKNRYGGYCANCNNYVEAEAGAVSKESKDSKWVVTHLNLDCPPKATPKPKVASSNYKVTEGIYKVGETIYKVQPSRGGNLYAKELILTEEGKAADWEYVGRRPFRTFSAETRLTLEEAKEFGKTHGICCACGALLTAEDSMEAGIGPVCAGRF